MSQSDSNLEAETERKFFFFFKKNIVLNPLDLLHWDPRF